MLDLNIVCGVISYVNFQILVLSLQHGFLNRSHNKFQWTKKIFSELGRDFPEVESKGYDSKTLVWKAKAWEDILAKFNPQSGAKSTLLTSKERSGKVTK